MKIYLFFVLVLLSITGVSAQTEPVKSQAKEAAEAASKVTVMLANGDRLTGTFISGDAKTIKINYNGTDLSFKLAEVRLMAFGNTFGSAGIGAFGTTTSTAAGSSIRMISGGVLNGKAVKLVQPAYPPAARAVQASGVVNVQVTIDEEGRVISANAVSGHPLLKRAAEQAASESTFSPTSISGQRVKVTGIIVYNFAVDQPVPTVN